MKMKQLSVFLENTKGRLRDLTGTLAQAKIDIRALSLAETADFGIVRMIVNKPDEAKEVIRAAGFTVRETPILAVEVPDQPGGLHGMIDLLSKNDMSIEYIYGFVEKRSDKALIGVRVENPDLAAKILTENGFSVLTGRDMGVL